jgi:regulator of protease activity HflC (stomatin/prohibitin superfamily)
MKTPSRARVRSVLVRTREWIAGHDIWVVLAALLLMMMLAFFWGNIVIAVHPGEAGVLWSRLSGTKTDRVYPEGLHLILPWNIMTIYNVRYQTTEHSFLVLSRDGLEIGVDVAVRFKPIDKLVPKLHQQVGPGYLDAIVIPEVNTAVRTVIGRFRPDELYAASFQEIQGDIVALARRRVRNRFVLIDDILVKTVRLPPIVAGAIQRKLEQEQLALEMQYRLSRERQEADRKVIEAQGIQEYQTRISSTLTPQLLQFKSIEAALDLARSSNTKVIVLGGGGTGMPIILNPDGLTGAPGVAPVPGTAPPRGIVPGAGAATPAPAAIPPAPTPPPNKPSAPPGASQVPIPR